MVFPSFSDRTLDLEQNNEDNYDDLIVSILASAGKFHLLIGVCDYEEDREAIIRRYEEELTPEFACYRVTLARGEPSLRAAIAELTEKEESLQQPTKAVVTVTGTEQLYFLRHEGERSEQEKFFGYLQWTREALRQFQFTIILWVTHQMQRNLSKRSPDFWSWNKGVFHFRFHKKKAVSGGEILPIREMFCDRWIDEEIDEEDPYFLPIDDLKELIRSIEKEKGRDDPNLAKFYTQLGKIYKRRLDKGECENYREEKNLAIQYFQKAIGFQKVLGLELDLADNLNNLANLYESQGKYKAAKPLYMQSLELRKKLLGEEHPDVATSLNNLAFLYESQRKYEAAEPLYMQSLELRKKLLGEEHPDVATSLNNLADLYKSQGKYEDAEPLFLQSLELRKKLLGQEHPDVATSLNNLAILYYLQGKYETAEPLFLQSLELSQKLLGEEHPYVANTLNNLANLYELQGKDEAAETLYHQSLELSQKLLGTARPETLYQALELSKNLLRQEGTETKIIRKNLANLQHKIQNSLSFLDRFIFLERFISIFNPLEPKIQIRSNMNPDLQAQTPKKPYYLIIHKRIRNRIAFHASYTFILGIWYQVLRYSIPVISGSLAAIVGTHQLSSETIVIWTSMVITFLGTLNSVISPSESYEWTVIFASQFENFLCDFDLKFQEIQDKGEEEILNFLNQQNKELSTLIDRFNKFPKHSDR